MIKDNQQKFNRLHVVLDALVLIISYAAAFGLLILGNRVYSPHKQVLPAQYYFIMLVWIVPLYLFLYGLCRLYAPKRCAGTGMGKRHLPRHWRKDTINISCVFLI